MQAEFLPDYGSPADSVGLLKRNPQLMMLSLVVLFLMAGVMRLYRIHAPGLLIDRDYMSAILARSFYLDHTDSVEGWRREMAHTTRLKQPTLEPPVTEFLVSLLYRAVGGEHLWLARLLTSLFWLVGGIFLFRTAKEVVSTRAAAFAIAYYLLNPLSILLSRSFQPDSLMMLLFLISLFHVVRYHEQPSSSRLVTAASLSAVTVLYRPLVLFPLLGAFAALTVSQEGGWKRLIDRRFLVYMAISLSPALLYYGYGTTTGFLRPQLEMSFRPYLLLRREFWMGWLYCIGGAVGYAAPIGAMIGAPMLRAGLPRALVTGLGIGYVAFGLVFTMHIHTHGYYQAVLIPIIAISVGPLVDLIAERWQRIPHRLYACLALIVAVVLAVAFSFLEVRSQLGSQVFESVETAKEIGEIVNHSSRVVFLARYYGQPLQYNGELSGAYWPRSLTYYLAPRPNDRELSIEQRLDELGFSPEYFVITDLNEFESQHADLQEYLARSCLLVAERRQYLVYGACTEPL